MALDAHDWARAKAVLDDADRNAKTWEDRSKIGYYRATLLAYTGDLEGSLTVLRARLDDVKAHPESAAEAWLHNQLTWVYWSLGDGAHALAETGEMSAALDRAKLPLGAVDAIRLHALWDRAYLLAESGSVVGSLPSSDAVAAKETYETLATRLDDLSGIAVLRAYFAVRAKDKSAAHAALATPELVGDEDMQDVYVLASAYDLVGDTENAQAQRAHIAESKNAYLMHAIIVRRLASEVTK